MCGIWCYLHTNTQTTREEREREEKGGETAESERDRQANKEGVRREGEKSEGMRERTRETHKQKESEKNPATLDSNPKKTYKGHLLTSKFSLCTLSAIVAKGSPYPHDKHMPSTLTHSLSLTHIHTLVHIYTYAHKHTHIPYTLR